MGVGSRLIPLFLISKYHNPKILWSMYGLVNLGLILFIFNFLFFKASFLYLIAIAAILASIILFAWFCYKAYKDRLRKKVDDQVRISLLSILMMLIPIIFVAIILVLLFTSTEKPSLVLAYGFCIFFGWITAIIFGMTFKTLPFILWNKNYHDKAGIGKTPNPRELFDNKQFKIMTVFYLLGFILFVAGILCGVNFIMKIAAILLIVAAIFYNLNVFKMFFHKADIK
jgi:hypothetical protein